MSNRRGRGGIGRRARFRFLWGKTRGGSIPLARIRLLSTEKILMQKSNLNHCSHGSVGPDDRKRRDWRAGEARLQVRL